jgi:hypothetical protein
LFIVGCSAQRRIPGNKDTSGSAKGGKVRLSRISEQNLTLTDFYIEKAEYNIKTNNFENNGSATIKFIRPDKYLISLKTFGGIELARVLLKGDSVFMNNRLEHKFVYGSDNYLKSKFGLGSKIVPLIFGDFIGETERGRTESKCDNGNSEIETTIDDIDIEYLIDCGLNKGVNIKPVLKGRGASVEISSGDFFVQENVNIPGKIEIHEKINDASIIIEIKKIQLNWKGEIEFIPGKQYDRIKLK